MGEKLPPEDRQLPEELRIALDGRSLRCVAEYMCERLGLDDGTQRLELHFSGGFLREASMARRRIGVREFEYLAARESPAVE